MLPPSGVATPYLLLEQVTSLTSLFALTPPLLRFVTPRRHLTCSRRLDDHLRDALSTQRLAALECLALETSKRVEDGREEQDHGSSDQAGDSRGNASPLYCAHGGVESGAQKVGLELANESVEFGRRRTDPEEQRYFEEKDDRSVYQAHDTKRNDPIGIEEVRYSEREA